MTHSGQKDVFVSCLIPLHLKEPLTYIWPFKDKEPIIGTRLLLPLKNRDIIGILWEKDVKPPDKAIELKKVKKILDEEALLSNNLLSFLKWAANYYFYPLGKAVAEALPPEFISSTKKGTKKISNKNLQIGKSKFEIRIWYEEPIKKYSLEQEKAISEIEKALLTKHFKPILLFGVTGCGKTAVYIEAVKRCLKINRSALVMVPEIAMTSQLAGRFKAVFGEQVALLHSGLSQAQRRDEWLKIKKGICKVTLGTRSAIFSPLKDLGLIVVDEEHDHSYKQEDRFKYNARDLALVRGKMEGATVVLGSGTPSVQSFYNAEIGRYRLIEIKNRIPGAKLPKTLLIDRRKKVGQNKTANNKKKINWLSERLKEEISNTLDRKEQVLIFLNRRGFATFIFCPECGYVFKCKACDVTLSWHRKNKAILKKAEDHNINKYSGLLSCHYCGENYPALPICPKCKGQTIKTAGFGTEKIADDLLELFPGITVARVDRDTLSRRKELEEILFSFKKGEIDCLVGTQMITKGHDFPNLTLVGIIWADMSLNVPEFNAAERTFQLLSQVAGRAGRMQKTGKVLVQTFMPDHYSITCSVKHDFLGFYKKEIELRKELFYPPFRHMVNLRLSGTKKNVVEKYSEKLFEVIYRNIEKQSEIKILGPVPCPKTRIKSKYRFQILLKGKRQNLRKVCYLIDKYRSKLLPTSVQLEIDVDPISFT